MSRKFLHTWVEKGFVTGAALLAVGGLVSGGARVAASGQDESGPDQAAGELDTLTDEALAAEGALVNGLDTLNDSLVRVDIATLREDMALGRRVALDVVSAASTQPLAEAQEDLAQRYPVLASEPDFMISMLPSVQGALGNVRWALTDFEVRGADATSTPREYLAVATLQTVTGDEEPVNLLVTYSASRTGDLTGLSVQVASPNETDQFDEPAEVPSS